MLSEFLAANRERILALAGSVIPSFPISKPAGAAIERRLPELYQRLVRAAAGAAKARHGRGGPEAERVLAQAAYGYASISSAIAETAAARGFDLGAGDLRALADGLELAIAEAVPEHKGTRPHAAQLDEVTRMGFLVHELRNALACVFVAQGMNKKYPGGENALLERNLQHMRSMLDRASVEVRLHKEPEARLHPMPVAEAVREVEATAGEEARLKGVTLTVRVDPRLVVNADGSYLVSALANLVRNAIKFTPPGGAVRVRGLEKNASIVLEVEDQCGGLPGGDIGELFEPFTQKGEDRSGLGLGLAISRRAVALNNGVLSARDIPGKGCVFSIVLPRVRGPRSTARAPAGLSRRVHNRLTPTP
ncbi:MAG: HAMP domain-containing sensor histidine kinase [Elusimicrobia bacterium]|nr:HAMP domain-containing sensor histidine kinase [Elusimicrobiota bacterium]